MSYLSVVLETLAKFFRGILFGEPSRLIFYLFKGTNDNAYDVIIVSARFFHSRQTNIEFSPYHTA